MAPAPDPTDPPSPTSQRPELSLLQAARREPSNPEHVHRLGRLFAAGGELGRALSCYDAALKLDPDHAEAWFDRGVLLCLVKRADEAIPCLRRAVELRPGSASGHAALANALELCRRTPEAQRHAERALALEPQHVQARLVLATLARSAGDLARARELLEPVAGGAGEAAAQAAIALAHVLDAMGEYPQAFNQMREAQARMLRAPQARAFDRQAFPALLERLERFARAGASGVPLAAEVDRLAPIFIIGFPRSGTTLMEQILAAHPQVHTFDEHPYLDAIVAQLPDAERYPAGLARTPEAALQDARRRYREMVSASAPQGKVVVDKLPLNIVHVPLIRLLFPSAKLLVMLRDPRDCVLSGFFQAMSPNAAMVHLHSPEDCATLYQRVMRAWLACRELPGLNVREQRYEDLVAEPEPAVRAVLEFLELPFDPACLRHQDKASTRAVYTPSRHDVGKPVYRSAAGRFRNYLSELAPVLPQLQPFVERFGYAPESSSEP